jgi:mono/diheme cytochrome c family protein
LYFALLVPDGSGTSRVLKIRYAPEAEYPFTLDEELNPVVLINTHGCLACHSLGDSRDGAVGPVLDRATLVPRLEKRLNSEAYALTLEELDRLESEPVASFREERRAIAQAEGMEKINLWLRNRILEPKFDDPHAAMPRQGLSSAQAKAIAEYLSGASEGKVQADGDRGAISRSKEVANKIIRPVENRLPYPTRENAKIYLVVMFGIGLFAGAVGLAIPYWLFDYRRR